MNSDLILSLMNKTNFKINKYVYLPAVMLVKTSIQ